PKKRDCSGLRRHEPPGQGVVRDVRGVSGNRRPEQETLRIRFGHFRRVDPSASRGSLASVPAAITAAGLQESWFPAACPECRRTEWTGVLWPPTRGTKAIRKPNATKRLREFESRCNINHSNYLV